MDRDGDTLASRPVKVLMVTSEWPSPELPYGGCFIEQQVRFLRKAGVDIDVMPFVGRRKPLNYWRIWGRVRRTIRDGDYDLVHAQFGHSGALAVTPKRLPVVVTYRGDDLLADRFRRAVSRYAARRADANIVVARRMASELPEPPVAVIPSGIDFDLFRKFPRVDARRRLELPEGERLALFVGSPHVPRKRFSLAQQALDLIEDARLLPAWGVPRETIPLYMNAANLLLLVSKWEGSPNVVKEALACDLPVVAVDVGDTRERLGTVDGCVVVSDDSPESIADAVRAVLDRDEEIDGAASVRSLDETLLAQETIDVYRSVLRASGT